MRISVACVLVAITFAASSALAKDNTVKVLVLGTYHMGNPGLDLVNAQAEDVTTPERQKELEEVARRLAKFKPTKIAIEARPTRDDFISEKYPAFTPEDLKTKPDERIQIGYRLAHSLGHENVYTIDEQSDEIDYFPFGAVMKFAEENGRASEIQAMMDEIGANVKEFEASQEGKSIRQLLIAQNIPPESLEGHEKFYYGLLSFGSPKAQPGAELNAYWYMRNAKIFSKLMQVAEPGDRILLIYGAGHNYWLRHFAETTPGYVLVEAVDYLGKH
jgi:hypothetical protein